MDETFCHIYMGLWENVQFNVWFWLFIGIYAIPIQGVYYKVKSELLLREGRAIERRLQFNKESLSPTEVISSKIKLQGIKDIYDLGIKENLAFFKGPSLVEAFKEFSREFFSKEVGATFALMFGITSVAMVWGTWESHFCYCWTGKECELLEGYNDF